MLAEAALVAVGVLLMLDAAFRICGVIAVSVSGTLLLVLSLASRQVAGCAGAAIRWPVSRRGYTFGADGIVRRQAEFECRWGWARILGVEESPLAFMLRLGEAGPRTGRCCW